MKTILIAEDETMLLKSLEFKLKKEGYNVIAAKDGQEAITFFGENEVDMVITDMMMPFKNGLEVIATVKEKNKDIPVLFLSSVGQEEMVVKAFDLGASDYMTKPFSPNELASRINRIIN